MRAASAWSMRLAAERSGAAFVVEPDDPEHLQLSAWRGLSRALSGRRGVSDPWVGDTARELSGAAGRRPPALTVSPAIPVPLNVTATEP